MQQRIEQLLRICTTPSLRRFPAPPGRLTEFGLAPAALQLRLNDRELMFGATDPIHGWRYIRMGDQIHLIGDGFHHHLTASASAFLRGAIMPELPEVETTRRGITPHILGQRVSQVAIRQPRLRWPVPLTIAEILPSERLRRVDRRGKVSVAGIRCRHPDHPSGHVRQPAHRC